MDKKILVISPHPDDETLGCGGTLLKHKYAGDELNWLIMTKISKKTGYSVNKIKNRIKEIKSVSKKYGFKQTLNLNYETTSLDSIPISNIIKKLGLILIKVKPNILYAPFGDDVHTDHRVTLEAILSATKTFRVKYLKKIRLYETLSETDFNLNPNVNNFKPNLWIDISDFIEKKIEIMKIYKSEIGKHPFPRSEISIKSLATIRGISANCDYAEGFISIKEIL